MEGLPTVASVPFEPLVLWTDPCITTDTDLNTDENSEIKVPHKIEVRQIPSLLHYILSLLLTLCPLSIFYIPLSLFTDTTLSFFTELSLLQILHSLSLPQVVACLASKLRPHQREGVQFLFDCTMGMKGFEGEGCILADDMGLGMKSVVWCVVWCGVV